MDTKELPWMRTQTVAALQKAVAEAEAHLQAFRFQISSNQLKTVRNVREVRQEISRLKTVLQEKHFSQK